MALSAASASPVVPQASSAVTQTGSGSGADLLSLRAAPARPNGNSAANGSAMSPAQVEANGQDNAPGRPQAATPETHGAPASAAAATATAASAAENAGPTFGQTLAAQRPATPNNGRSSPKAKTTTTKADPQAATTAANAAATATAATTPGASPLVAGAAAAPQGSTVAATDTAADSAEDQDPGGAAIAPAALAAARAGSALAATGLSARAPAASAPTDGAGSDDETDADAGTEESSASPVGGAFTLSARAALAQTLAAASRSSGNGESETSGSESGASATALADTGTAPSAGAAASTAAPAQSDATTATAQPGATTATAQLHSAVGSSAWANELGARLHWMAGQGVSSASLKLTPEQLGPVEVKISMHENSASVFFSASQPETRSALEAALPRLKDLFSAQGLNLAQAGVSDQSARGAQSQAQAAAAPRSPGTREDTVTGVTTVSRTHQGLIDTYA